jgi:hypothetical protein
MLARAGVAGMRQIAPGPLGRTSDPLQAPDCDGLVRGQRARLQKPKLPPLK